MNARRDPGPGDDSMAGTLAPGRDPRAATALSPLVLVAQLALLLGAAPLAAQSTAARGVERQAGDRALTPAQALEDFDILRHALEETHAGLYRYSRKPDLDRRFDALRARLERPVDRPAFIGVVSGMLAEIRCGHTRLEYDDSTNAALARARQFPLGLAVEGSRLMVVSNDTPDDATIRPGMEVLRINGRTATEVLDLLLPRLPGDGFIETGKRVQLGRSFGRYYWLFVDQAAEFLVTARDSGGPTVTTRLAGVVSAERARNGTGNPVNARMLANAARLEGSRENVALRFVSGRNIAHLRVRAFAGAAYPDQIEAAFRTLRDSGTTALILDLRGNGGGDDLYGALLVSQFTDRPFRYFDRIHVTTIRPSFATWRPSSFEELRDGTVADPAGGYLVTPRLHEGVSERSPSSYPFLGRVIVLLDGGTFSTAADVTAVLHNMGRATFVGVESGGGYYGNTSGLNALIVPRHSRLRLRIPMYGYWNAVSAGEQGRGTRPDHAVERRTADVLRGIDEQWERAIALARVAPARQPN
jgi:hypothetical protein